MFFVIFQQSSAGYDDSIDIDNIEGSGLGGKDGNHDLEYSGSGDVPDDDEDDVPGKRQFLYLLVYFLLLIEKHL